MNQGRIWCVVHPTVGLPLLLGSVTAISLIVHASVMSNTTWMSRYWQGGAKANKTVEGAAPAAGSAVANAQPGVTISVSPVAPAPGKSGTSFVVNVSTDQPAPATAAATRASPPPAREKMAAAVPKTP